MRLSRRRNSFHRKSLASQQGVSLVMIAIMLPILILLCGFAINLSQVQLVRTEIQCATDASARAAGRTYNSTQDRALALQIANEIADRNPVSGSPLKFRPEDLEIGVSIRNDVGARYRFTPGGTDTNAVRLHGLRTDDSPNGAVNYIFPVFTSKTIQFAKSAVSTQAEVDIVLVFDRSGSMAYATDEPASFPPAPSTAPAGWTFDSPVPPNSRWLDAIDAADAFLSRLSETPQREKVALVTYADNANVDVPLSHTYADIEFGLNTYSNSLGGGGTNISSGLRRAARALTNDTTARPFATKVAIVMTDGKYNLGGNPGIVAQSIAGAGVTIFTVTFSEEADEQTMIETAMSGGGLHFHAQTRDDLITVFEEIAKTLPTLLTE